MHDQSWEDGGPRFVDATGGQTPDGMISLTRFVTVQHGQPLIVSMLDKSSRIMATFAMPDGMTRADLQAVLAAIPAVLQDTLIEYGDFVEEKK